MGFYRARITFIQALTYALLAVLTAAGVCSGQAENRKKVFSGALPGVEADKPSDGIVYFSYDNGSSWKNVSAGLPFDIRIGLGGIASSGNRLALLSKNHGLYFFNAGENRWMPVPTDKQLIENNPGALLFHKNGIYAGTQTGGVFYSGNEGRSWTRRNEGLENLTIRKFAAIGDRLYAGTNAGLYSYNEAQGQWEPEYASGALQVNGIAAFERGIYIATNQGAFTSPTAKREWRKIYSNGALHNIGADDKTLYAMVYNELLASHDKGVTWHNIQQGLPALLYTFTVIKSGQALLAGQWDGVYRKDKDTGPWKFSGAGLPEKLAIANMQLYNGILVVSGSERKLKAGMTTSK